MTSISSLQIKKNFTNISCMYLNHTNPKTIWALASNHITKDGRSPADVFRVLDFLQDYLHFD